MAGIDIVQTYPGKESLDALVELITAGNTQVEFDSETPTVISYAVQELKTYPETLKKEPGFANFIEQMEQLDNDVIERNKIDSDAIWDGKSEGIDVYRTTQRLRQFEQSTQVLKASDPLEFHYAIEEKTNKIASAYQTIDGKVLPDESEAITSINNMFHMWLEENDMLRRNDGVYIKDSDGKLADTQQLRDLINDSEKGFKKYLLDAGINNISLYEQEYKISTPQVKDEVVPEVEESAEELSTKATQQTGMGT